MQDVKLLTKTFRLGASVNIGYFLCELLFIKHSTLSGDHGVTSLVILADVHTFWWRISESQQFSTGQVYGFSHGRALVMEVIVNHASFVDFLQTNIDFGK